MSRLFCILVIAGAISSQAKAQYCGSYSYGHSYVAPTIIKERIVKEYVPTVALNPYPVLAVPVYSYVSAVGYTPGAGYGSVIQQQQAPQQQQDNSDAIAERIATKILAKIEQRLTPATNNGQQQQQEQQDGPPPITNGVKPSDFMTKAVTILQNKCAICHSGSAASGGLSLFNPDKTLKPMSAELLIKVYDSVYEGRMPKGNDVKPLSDQEVEYIRLWMRESIRAR